MMEATEIIILSFVQCLIFFLYYFLPLKQFYFVSITQLWFVVIYFWSFLVQTYLPLFFIGNILVSIISSSEKKCSWNSYENLRCGSYIHNFGSDVIKNVCIYAYMWFSVWSFMKLNRVYKPYSIIAFWHNPLWITESTTGDYMKRKHGK